MNTGNPKVVVRLSKTLLAAVQADLEVKVLDDSSMIADLSSWIRAAIIEKLAKTARGRQKRANIKDAEKSMVSVVSTGSHGVDALRPIDSHSN